MQRIDKTVFISYRRASVPWVLAIYQSLTHHGYDVFFDYEGVGSGDFEQVILGNIKARAHFLVLLTPSALERIDEPGDWLRREIEEAIATKRNIVPLMLEGFDFGTPSVSQRLTGSLAPLRRYNGLPIVVSYFGAAMERLRRIHLNVALDAVHHPPSLAAVSAARHHQAAASSAPPVPTTQLTAEQWYERGVETKDPAEQIRCFTEVIRLSPTHVMAYVRRAEARIANSDRTGFEDYDAALRLETPYSDFVYWSRAVQLQKLGDFDGALRDAEEAIRLKPTNSFNVSLRGHVLRERGDLVGAEAAYSEAIRLDPTVASYYSFRAWVRMTLRDLTGALADADETIRLEPNEEKHRDRRTMVLTKLGKASDK